MTKVPLRWGYLPLADSIATLLCCQEITKEGIPGEAVKFANNHLLLEAFRRGEIDGGVSSAVFLPDLEKDEQINILGAASREGVTVFAAKGGKFKDASNWRGAIISLPAKMTVHGALLYKTLQKQGLEWGEVNVKYLSPGEGFKALAEGAVDLVPALEPLASRIEAEEKFLPAAYSRHLWPRHLSFLSFISSDRIRQNPELMIKWEESFEKAVRRISSDYKGVAEAAALLLGSDASQLQKVLQPLKPKILYDGAEVPAEEKKEWSGLISGLKKLA